LTYIGNKADSDSASLGSNPSPPANLSNNLALFRTSIELFGSNAGLTAKDFVDLGFASAIRGIGKGYPRTKPPSIGITAPVT